MQVPQGYVLIKKEEYQYLLDTIKEQSKRIEELEFRIKILESQLSKNSRNSSIPPSKEKIRVYVEAVVKSLEDKKDIKE